MSKRQPSSTTRYSSSSKRHANHHGMTTRLPAVLACCLLATACGGDDTTEPDASQPDASTRVSYARDVQPIFARCVICHHPGGIVDLDLTDPFDPEHGLIGRKNSWAEAHE